MNQKLLNKLTELWGQHPDLRFGQLIENVRHMRHIHPVDFFYLDDQEFMELMDIFNIRSYNENHK